VNRTLFPARVVLLDWDGTLLNSYAADVRAYLAMFKALEIKWSIPELERHYSPNWYRVYQAAGIPRSKWTAANRLWRRAYSKETPKLLPWARSVLKSLRRNFRLAVVTSGSRDRVWRQLREFELVSYFSACVCSEDAPRKKPHPAPLLLALERLGAKPDHCVYVGDAPEDIQMARRAGVRAIGVLGPFPTSARIRAEKPQALLQSIRELPRYLRSFDRA
jgi:HAD superfamily hydrolase (TIGR01509 family)